jgi:hypothetical protein
MLAGVTLCDKVHLGFSDAADGVEKTSELIQDLSVLKQSHQRHLDHQDSTIDAWSKDLDECEDQIQSAVAGHIRTLEGLIQLQVDRLTHAWELFDRDLTGLDSEFSSERYAAF